MHISVDSYFSVGTKWVGTKNENFRQWVSEHRTSPVFKWLKFVCLIVQCQCQTKVSLVFRPPFQYWTSIGMVVPIQDHHLNTGQAKVRHVWMAGRSIKFGHFRIKSNFEFAKLGRFHFFLLVLLPT